MSCTTSARATGGFVGVPVAAERSELRPTTSLGNLPGLVGRLASGSAWRVTARGNAQMAKTHRPIGLSEPRTERRERNGKDITFSVRRKFCCVEGITGAVRVVV